MAGLTLTRSGAADAGAFLARLRRLDPAALVRIRPDGPGRLALWARLPWEVLVTRVVAGSSTADAAVSAGALLAVLRAGDVPLPPRLDARWRWALPAGGGRTVEVLPAAQVRRLGLAAERAVRAAAAGGVAGRAVGERAVRDALLDHEAIVVESMSGSTLDRIAVPQRLVQAVLRMGFLGSRDDSPQSSVRVLAVGRFVGLAAEYGIAWYQKSAGLVVRAIV